MKVRIGTFITLFLVYIQTPSSEGANENNEEGLYKVLENVGFVANVTVRRVVPIMFGRSVHRNDNVIECSKSIEEFPEFFTDEEKKRGAVILAFIIATYCFTLIAIICDSYFLPCVERICEALNLSQDVAAATFMSVATSAPELFVNIIGTFVTQSDIGIGTVVGSSMFNTLGVAAIGGLAARNAIQLDWWPLTRDTAIYIIAIVLLVIITWDGKVFWYEAMVLFIVYFIYFTVMFQNRRISKFFKRCLSKTCTKRVSEEEGISKGCIELRTISCIDSQTDGYREQKDEVPSTPESVIEVIPKLEEEESLFRYPKGRWYEKVMFVYTWPIKFMLMCTVPDCKKEKLKKIFPATFIMCVIWIGLNSYMVSWMITVIGYTLGIQDSVLGLTFLAAGGCLPEAISITIMSRKAEGSMGISNALGANTMNILLSLGLPWFIKTAFFKNSSHIDIDSGSIEYTILALIIVAVTLYLTLTCNKFRLSRINGVILMVFYAIFLISAILSELFLFGKVECSS